MYFIRTFKSDQAGYFKHMQLATNMNPALLFYHLIFYFKFKDKGEKDSSDKWNKITKGAWVTGL